MVREHLEEMFLAEIGDVEVVQRRFIPGKNNTGDIKKTQDAIDSLAKAIGGTDNPTVIESLTRTMEAHAKTLAGLKSSSSTEDRWEETRTGETYREWWARSDWDARGNLLRRAGIALYLGGSIKAPISHIFIPEDLPGRAQAATGGQRDTEAEQQWSKSVEHAQKRP